MNTEVIGSTHFSKRFLQMLGAPENTRKLTFSCEAGHMLTCSAIFHDGDNLETLDSKTWEVELSRTSILYKLITGEL